MPQLAIVIPAYKDSFLKETLESIASQSCKDFTLYIGDDCSPFNLQEIVDEFRNDVNIVYRRFETNVGGKDLVAQWTRCIGMTQGEPYIWLFSDDDVMEKGCVQYFLELPREIKENYLVHFDIKIIDEQGSRSITAMPAYPQKMSALDFIQKKTTGCINSFVVEYIFPRYIYQKCGGFQNFDLAWGSDIITWFKFAAACDGIWTVKNIDAHVLWRRSSLNISPDVSHDIVVRKMDSLIKNAEFVQNDLLKIIGKKKYSIHAKSVWSAIVRHAVYLKYREILRLYLMYVKKVGFPIQSSIALFYSLIAKTLKLYHGYKK